MPKNLEALDKAIATVDRLKTRLENVRYSQHQLVETSDEKRSRDIKSTTNWDLQVVEALVTVDLTNALWEILKLRENV